MHIKRNILFFIDKEGTKEKGYKLDGKLRLRIRFCSSKVDFNVGYRVELSKWNTDSRRCKAGTTHGAKKISATEINREIQRLENLAEFVFKTYEISNKIPSISEFKNSFNVTNKTSNGDQVVDFEKDFFEIFDEFVTGCSIQNSWKEGTIEQFRAVKNHLKSFNPLISFEFFLEEGLNKYLVYLRDVNEMRHNTIKKHLGYLKWFLRWSTKKGYNNNIAFESFKPKLATIDKKVIFLTAKELKQMEEYQIPETKNYLIRVRDVFLFCCYTGLRYSDVFNLRKSDIKDGYIEITTIKTTDRLIIDLNKYSSNILNKYKKVVFEDDKALPVISNQRMNDYLKELGKLVGIDESIREVFHKGGRKLDIIRPKYELLGTHAGRRTFICNALSLGIPANIVMKWTGHSDYKAMRPYIDVADDIKAKEMKKFDNL